MDVLFACGDRKCVPMLNAFVILILAEILSVYIWHLQYTRRQQRHRSININELIYVSCLAEHMGHSHVLLATFEKVREMVLLLQAIDDKCIAELLQQQLVLIPLCLSLDQTLD